MVQNRWFSLPLALLVAGCMVTSAQPATKAGGAPCSAILAAGTPTESLAGTWQTSAVAALPAPRAPRNAADLGLAPAQTRLERMLLLLEPPATERQALDTLLANQQTPGNCAYHRWLTAAQYADAFANSGADANAIAAWLTGEGFSVAPLPEGRGWIEFSGTAGQVELAFGAQVHSYSTADGTRYALMGTISVPSAIGPLVRGLVSLDGAGSTAALTPPESLSVAPAALAAETSILRAAALTPQLAAGLLHLDALQSAGTVGAGETIAIAARSNVNAQDIDAFRAAFGLVANPVVVTPAGTDPGLTPDRAEAELAASWAGAAAPGARIVVVPAAGTAATDGIDLSLAAIVDQALAHTVVVGFSACESALSDAHQAFYAALYRQAAAEGMSAIAASGDSGAAACEAAGGNAAVTTGRAVNALASTPWNIAVGAAAFSPAGGAALAGWSPIAPADPGFAGGGGYSAVYEMPAWQTGQASSGRMLPDLVFPTAIDSAFSRGVAFCFGESATGCTLVHSGGSSAAAAIFGGISALISGRYGAQGMLQPRLYALSSRTGVFADVAQGNALLVCAAGSAGCDATGHIGYAAEKGYDLATGLGSPDIEKLVTGWPSPTPDGTTADTVTLSVSPTQSNSTYNPSANITFTAQVNGGSGTPTGTVNFYNDTTDPGHNTSLNSAPYGLNGSGQTSITLSGDFPNGGNNIEADYSGDGTYKTNNSQPVSVNIQPSTTTTAVQQPSTTPTTGIAFVVTATVAVGTPVAGTQNPTGQVTLTVDGSQVGAQAVSTNGAATSATFSVTINSAGNHNLQAIYAGDNNYDNSTSSVTVVNVQSNSANVALAVTPGGQSAFNPSASIALTATVTAQGGGTTPTGTVNFFDQTTNANLNSSPVQLAGGIGSITFLPSSAGLGANSNSIVAKYGGDTLYGTATSSAQQVNVQQSTTTTAVSSATNTPTTGTAFNVTATVTVGSPPAGTQPPTGKMTLTFDGSNYASSNVTSAGGVTSAIFSVTVPTAGQHNLQAIYAGDGNYATSTSSTVSVNANATAVTVALAVGPTQANAAYNPTAALTFTATVTPTQAGGATPSGAVNFLDQATGTNLNMSPVQLSGSGTAAVSITGGLPSGGNNIVAQYGGSGTYSAANSQTLPINIQPSTTTATVSPSTTTPLTGTAFTVTVTIAVGTPPAGSALPTGKVTLTLDGAPYGTAQLSTTSGITTASFSVTLSSGGSHNVQAVYAGDANYSSSTSSTFSVNASLGTTVTTLTATPATLAPGTPESFVATIAAANPVAGQTAPFTGMVTFFDGSAQLGSAPVSSGQATLSNVMLGTSTTHTITAVYSGDTNWAGSTSNAITLKAVLYPVTVTLTALPNIVAPGQVVTLTATVTPTIAPASTAEQNPTGNIVFYMGTTILGTVALSAGPGNTAIAQLLFTTLPAGTDIITAVYAGDLYFAAGTSGPVTITVQDFTITPSPTNEPEDLDIDLGQAGSASFIITGLGGYNGQLNVVCTVQPQDDMTCTPSPQQITPTGTVTFTVTTFLTGGPYTGTSRNLPPSWTRAAGGTALAAIVFFLAPSRRRTRIVREWMRRAAMLLLLALGLCGVGLGCSSVSGSIANHGGTPLGLTNLTITAAANIDNAVVSHSIDLTVDVMAPGATGTARPVIHVK